LIDAGEDVVAVITPIPGPKNNRFAEVARLAVEKRIEICQIKKKDLGSHLKRIKADLIISAGWPYLLTQEEISLAPLAVNVHGTLLPKYRGTRVIPHILMNHEIETGVTVHFIDPHMDTGDIILQKAFPISPFDTTRSLYRKVLESEPECVLKAVAMLKSGAFERKKQDHTKASVYAHMRTPEDSIIDPEKSLKDLIDDIRACDAEDYPAYFYHHGQKLCVKLWRPGKPEDEKDLL